MEIDKLILISSLQSPRIAKIVLNTKLENLYFQTPRHTTKIQLLNQYDISSRTKRLMGQKRESRSTHTNDAITLSLFSCSGTWLMTNVTLECSEENTVFLINGTREDPPEEAMATHSSNLAWRIPWTEGPEALLSTG